MPTDEGARCPLMKERDAQREPTISSISSSQQPLQEAEAASDGYLSAHSCVSALVSVRCSPSNGI